SQSPFHADLSKAIEYAQRAAAEALRILAYPEAIELFRRALASLDVIAPPDDPRSAPLLHGLGLSQRGAGRHTDAIETFRKLVVHARTRTDAELFAQAAIGLEDARYTARTAASASLPLLEESLSGLPRVASPLRAEILERLASACTAINDERR